MRAKLGRLLAWGVTAAALGWVFWKTPVGAVLEALRHAAPWMVPAVVAALALVYLADSFAMWKTFGWFLAKLPLRDVIIVRGATYLLAAINYNVGQGAIVYFVHRARGVPVMRGVATVLLIMGTNLVLLLALVTAGLAMGGVQAKGLAPLVGVVWIGLAAYAVVVSLKPRFLATKPMFDVLLSAGMRGHLKAMLVRIPHVAALIALQLISLRSLGVVIPLPVALATLPVVMFISALPISVQGLGTTQAAMVLFFAPYAPPHAADPRALIVGASLAVQGIGLAFQIAVGFICMRTRTARGLGNQQPAAPPPPATA